MTSNMQNGNQDDGSNHLAIVVEDHSAIALDIALTLKQAGFPRISLARRSAAAMAALDAASAQSGARLVVVDVGLGTDRDGIALAAEIRDRFGPGVSIIFLTGYDDGPTRERAERIGPLAYLTKPHDPAVLRDLAHRARAADKPG